MATSVKRKQHGIVLQCQYAHPNLGVCRTELCTLLSLLHSIILPVKKIKSFPHLFHKPNVHSAFRSSGFRGTSTTQHLCRGNMVTLLYKVQTDGRMCN
jgi:hypothetical protein